MPKVLIGREYECELLGRLLVSEQAEFLALYGRRRVGKTFLIRSYFKDTKAIFFNVTGAKNGKLNEQIKHFAEQLGRVFLNGIMPTVGTNWDDAFKILTHAMASVPCDQKIVLFFDELPWMATRNSRLLNILEYYWNQHWSDDERIKLIVCGSSASWIIKKIIKAKGGLHNRITRKIHLEPFNLIDTKRFLQERGIALNHIQLTQLYMVTGGIPYYLTYVEKHLSVADIIERLAFNKGSFLLEEFDSLFASLFDEYEDYIKIIRIIAGYRHGIGQQDLLEATGKSYIGTKGIRKLTELEDAGFILGFKPHFHKRRGKYYRVIDEYTLFYLRWIEPMRDSLQVRSLEQGNWREIQSSPAWYSWQGYAFEAICYKHIGQIRKKLAISPTAIANSWRYVPRKGSEEKGAQIDLLFDRRDEAITLCEIKFTMQPFTIDKQYAQNLLNKKKVFATNTRTRKQLFVAMISASGVNGNLYADDLLSGIVVLDDLFEDM